MHLLHMRARHTSAHDGFVHNRDDKFIKFDCFITSEQQLITRMAALILTTVLFVESVVLHNKLNNV